LATTSSLPEDLRLLIVDSYAASIRTCFVAFTAIAGCCFILSFFIKVSRKRGSGVGNEMAGN
jgi:hypothetical protein